MVSHVVVDFRTKYLLEWYLIDWDLLVWDLKERDLLSCNRFVTGSKIYSLVLFVACGGMIFSFILLHLIFYVITAPKTLKGSRNIQGFRACAIREVLFYCNSIAFNMTSRWNYSYGRRTECAQTLNQSAPFKLTETD